MANSIPPTRMGVRPGPDLDESCVEIMSRREAYQNHQAPATRNGVARKGGRVHRRRLQPRGSPTPGALLPTAPTHIIQIQRMDGCTRSPPRRDPAPEISESGMEFVERNAPAKGKELLGALPSGGQPHELSRRLDSSFAMPRGRRRDGRQGKPRRLPRPSSSAPKRSENTCLTDSSATTPR